MGGNTGKAKCSEYSGKYFLVALTVDLDKCVVVQNKYSQSPINAFQYYFYKEISPLAPKDILRNKELPITTYSVL